MHIRASRAGKVRADDGSLEGDTGRKDALIKLDGGGGCARRREGRLMGINTRKGGYIWFMRTVCDSRDVL